MEQQTGLKFAKEHVKAIYPHPAYLTSMQCTSCKMPGWMEHKLESRLLREVPTTSNMQIIPLLKAGSEEELKSLLMRVKGESEKASLKLNIQKTKIMASRPIASWQTEGEKVKAVIDSIFMGSKITVDSDHRHEIKRCLLLGRKTMTHLDSIFKSRDITWWTKVQTVKNTFFPTVMYNVKVGP